MMKSPFAFALMLLSVPTLALAQPAAEPAPGPGPEIREMGYYAGSWEGHGETLAGPFGEAGALSSHMTCEWFTGGFQMVCRGEETGPSGARGFLNIKSWDEVTRTYSEYSVSSLGESEYSRGGTLDGNRLTWTIEQDLGGTPTRIRYTEVRVSPVLMTYQAEISVDGQPWSTLARGEIAKVG
jgi:hypothetical protein